MEPDRRIDSVELVLTTRCNLDCAYCYQNAKSDRSMGGDVVHASVDLALRSPATDVVLRFYGGEPLLEFPLLRRAVSYAEGRGAREKGLSYEVVTNGLLLSDDALRFLRRHRCRVLLSFDGVRPAQDIRGEGTFDILDRRIGDMEDVTVSITLTPAHVPYLADSVDYFVQKGIADISIAPIVTPFGDWSPGRIDDLEEQFAAISKTLGEHYRRTGRVPLLVLRKGSEERPQLPPGRPMCGVLQGRNVAVDVDGSLYPCALLCPSFQDHPSSPLWAPLASLCRGNVLDPAPGRARPDPPGGAARLFGGKRGKRSSYGRCETCGELARCHVCPLSIALIPGNEDPDRVPDFLCAYNKVALRHRDLFPALTATPSGGGPV